MEKTYKSFHDLPSELTRKLKEKIVNAEESLLPEIPVDASLQQRMEIHREAFKSPTYTEHQLFEIVDAFITCNTAINRGLPNELYQIFVRALDTQIAVEAHAANAVWYAHEGERIAMDAESTDSEKESKKRLRSGQTGTKKRSIRNIF